MLKIYFSLLALLAFVGISAHAQETANPTAQHAILVNWGFTAGGMALGADYENGIHRTFGIGGYIRMYPDGDDDNPAAEVNAFGAFIRPHFTRQAWDFYVSPGFGFVSVDNGNDDESTLGPIFMVGLLYQFSGPMAFGVEQTHIYAWLDEDIRGEVMSEMLAKFRFSF